MTKLSWLGLGAMALCAACGGGGGGGGDDDGSPDAQAGQPDAAVDGVQVGTVQVTAYTRCCTDPPHTPAAGVTIHLLRPDHTLATTVTTGADGRVSLDGVAPGSAVMAFYPESPTSGNFVTTVLGVEPGDALVFGDDFEIFDHGGPGGQFTITYPPIVADSIVAMLPCYAGAGLGPSPWAIPLDEDCQSTGATVPILAYDAAYHVVGSAVLRDLNLAIGESATVEAWSAPVEQAVQATVPASVNAVDFYIEWRYPNALPSDGRQALLAGGLAIATFPGPTGAAENVVGATLSRSNFGPQTHARSFAGKTSPIDLPITALAWLGPTLTDAPAQRIQWIQDGDGGDAVVANVLYDHRDENDVQHSFDWTVIAPLGDNELGWADLPLELPAPRGDDELAGTRLTVVDLDTAGSYAALRSLPEWQIRCPLCSVSTGELNAGSTAAAGGAQ